jgi:tellurite resistance protein TerC
VIGSTDVLFAVDSIPAIMGISQDPFVVLTSIVFAVLGLNALFFAIRGIMGMFKFLKHGVSIILFFIGIKMIAGIYHPIEAWFKESPYVPLLVIVTVLVASIVLSIWHDQKSKHSTPPADDKKPDYEV